MSAIQDHHSGKVSKYPDSGVYVAHCSCGHGGFTRQSTRRKAVRQWVRHMPSKHDGTMSRGVLKVKGLCPSDIG